MRKIKFRAWNGEQMVSPDYIDRQGTAHWIENSIPTKSEIVMQFTGMLDKNGKEIYEGDLLRRQFRVYWIVEFCNGEWRANPKHKTGLYLSYDQFQETEIVGNIYENSDLLK